MEKENLHKELLSRKQRMVYITNELKQTFVGLDQIIDEVMNLVSTWYLFAQFQRRPTVINMWGMTGSGKTALIQKLVELLDHKKLYAQMDMGEFESDSASWIKSTFTDDLQFFHEQPAIVCLDEFQFARTVDGPKELGKDKLRVIWELLDSGRLSYIPSGNSYHLRRAELCLMSLIKAKARGVKIENGLVVQGESEFLEVFKGFYFEEHGRSGKPLDKNYFLSQDFLQGLYYLYDDDNTTRDVLDEKVKKATLEDLAVIIDEGVKTRTGVKILDLSRALIFVVGNLDEAYHMSSSMNPDISADELHEATLKINIAHVKSALKKRFRHEQIARLGNNHIIYRSFTTSNFKELIALELHRINQFVMEEFGFSVSFHSSVHDIVYREGVFPAQGTRPVFTTIKNLIETWVSKLALEILEKNLKASVVEWSYCEDKYVFVFKDPLNNVLNIYEEKINLKIDSLRKISNKNIQAHTAVHEAGHAILAALTLRIIPSIVVSKTAFDNCEGFCMVNLPEGLVTRDTLKKDIIITLGGFVAEKLVFGEEHTSSGVYSDLENASSLANRAVKYYGMGADPLHIAVQAVENNEYFFNKDTYAQEAMQLIRSCEAAAEEMLERNKLLLLKMAEYLTSNTKMEEAMIEDYVKQFGAEEWIHTTGFVKKEEYFSFDAVIKNKLHELKPMIRSSK